MRNKYVIAAIAFLVCATTALATIYPPFIDTFVVSIPGAVVSSADVNNVKSAVVALETKVGVDGSAVVTTIDYLLKNPASIDPGHKHTAASLSAADGVGSIQFNAAGSFAGDSTNLFWDNAAKRLGIGTNTPAFTLDVNGASRITGKLTVTGAIDPTQVLLTGGDKRFGATDAGTVYLAPFTNSTTGVQVRAADNTSSILDIDTTNSRVGVGTTSPTVKFEVNGNSKVSGNLQVTGIVDPTQVLLTGGDKRFGATDSGTVYLAPFADSLTGIQVRKADNTTSVWNVDTTNSRIGILNTAPTSTLSIGATSQFQVNSTGNLVKINNVTYSWPGTQGASATALLNDGAGNLSWTSVAVPPGGSTGAVQFNSGGSFAGDTTNFFWDNTAKRLGIGTNAPAFTLDVNGASRITGKLTVTGQVDPTQVLLSGGDKRFGATDAGTVYLAPQTNSTTGVQIRLADNATVVFDADTTNSRIGIKVTPTVTFDVNGNTKIKGEGNSGTTDIITIQNSDGNPAIHANYNRSVIMPIRLTVGNNAESSQTAEVDGDGIIGGNNNDGTTTGVYMTTGGSTYSLIQSQSRSTAVTTVRTLAIQPSIGKVSFGDNYVSTVSNGNSSYSFTDNGSSNTPTADDFFFRMVPRTTIDTTNSAGALVYHGLDMRLATTGGTSGKELTNQAARVGASGVTTGWNRSLKVDNGLITYVSSAKSLANGTNNDVSQPGSSFMRVTGPSASFTITSVTGGTAASLAPKDGDWLVIRNTTAQSMTITNEAGSGTAANRFHLSTGVDLTIPGEGQAQFIYDGTLSRWVDLTSKVSYGNGASGVAGAIQFSDGTSGFNSDATKFFWDNSAKALGLGTNTPAGRLDVLAATEDTDFFRLQMQGNVSSADAVSETVRQADIETTDNSVTTADTISTASNRAYFITTRVVARRSDSGTEAAGFECEGTFRNTGGTLASVSQACTIQQRDSVAWTVDFATSGTNILVRVTGENAKTIDWAVTTRTNKGIK